MNKKINYLKLDFKSVRQELIQYVRTHYPDTYSDFDDASIGAMLIDLNAGVTDILANSININTNENFIDQASQSRSLYEIAKTNGIKLPNNRPAITIVDFKVTLPTKGSTFDLSYAPLILQGAKVTGNGQVFETQNAIDFSSPYSVSGQENRSITPNINLSTNKIQSYTLTKRELVVAGKTKFFKKIITSADQQPFLDIILPDNDVISVENVIQLEGTGYNSTPTISQQTDVNNIWYVVNSLSDNLVFIANNTSSTDSSNIVSGAWEEVSKRFIYEFTNKGFCKLTFGNGYVDTSDLNDYVSNSDFYINQINNNVNQFSLGEIPKSNTTLFVKYRVGGGVASNVGVNTITDIQEAIILVAGSNTNINNVVKSSLSVSNPIPALGGRGKLTFEEIKNYVKYNFSSQNRCVTLEDYYSKIGLIDTKFGVPYRYAVSKVDDTIEITILNSDINGKLSNLSTNTMKDNIKNYLTKFKSPTDVINISDGKIINLTFEFDIIADLVTDRNEIAYSIINDVSGYINNSKLNMGDDIKLSNLLNIVNNVSGVLNISDMRVYNPVGGKYSDNKISQPLTDEESRLIKIGVNNALIANYNEVFEIYNENIDIKIRYIYGV